MNGRPPDGDDEDDRVGYCRPPKHTRFQKGNRANPLGRGASRRSGFAKDVRETMAAKVEISERGRKRQVSRQEATILALFEKAKRGDAAAADRLLERHRLSTRAGEGRTSVIEVYNILPDEEGERPILVSDGNSLPDPPPQN